MVIIIAMIFLWYSYDVPIDLHGFWVSVKCWASPSCPGLHHPPSSQGWESQRFKKCLFAKKPKKPRFQNIPRGSEIQGKGSMRFHFLLFMHIQKHIRFHNRVWKFCIQNARRHKLCLAHFHSEYKKQKIKQHCVRWCHEFWHFRSSIKCKYEGHIFSKDVLICSVYCLKNCGAKCGVYGPYLMNLVEVPRFIQKVLQ